MTVHIGLAFLAGLASFLSPCVFSLVPAYIGYLGGRSIAGVKSENWSSRLSTLLHGLFFVFGFSMIFIILGVAVSAFGGLFYDLRIWISRIGGIVVILFGLHLTGVFRIKFLDQDIRPQSQIDIQRGYLSSFLMGIIFSAGWSPCVGPVLSAILTIAITEGSVINGVKLLTAYSAGLAIPFLLAALGIGWVTYLLRRYGKFLLIVEVFIGIILILVGVLLFLGKFEQIAQYGQLIDFGF